MAQAFPPGGTYFDNAKRSFTDVPIDESKDNAIATTEFLEASEAVAGLFDVLGSAAFRPVKNDISGNITVCYHYKPHPVIDAGLAVLAEMLESLTPHRLENPQPPTRRPSRLRNPPNPCPKRTQNKIPFRIRGPPLAHPRPRFHRASPPPEPPEPRRRALDFLPSLLRQHAETSSLVHD